MLEPSLTPMDALRRAAARPLFRLGVFAVVALAASWRPLGEAGALNDFRDSHLVHTYEEVAVRTVLEHGQVPLWNPWSCGGMYGLGNPQTRFASPTFLASLALGARRAEPVLLFFFLLLAMEGMFRFARLRSPSALAPFLTAPFFGLVGYGAIAWTLGWMSFLGGFLLTPWVLYGTARLGRGEVGGAVPLVLGAGTMLGLGGSYPLALAAVFCALEAARSLWERRSLPGAAHGAGLLAAAGLLVVGALAVRLGPVWETLEAAPRIMAGRPGHGPGQLAQMLFLPARGASGTQAIFTVVPLAALLGVVGLLRWRRALPPLLIFAFAFWCATGHQGQSPYVWLKALPLFDGLRYPERFLFPGAVYLVEASSVGLSTLWVLARRRRWRPGWLRPAAVGAAALCLVGWAYGVHNFEVLSRRSTLTAMPPQVDQPFAQARGNRWIAGHLVALNRGSIACGEAYPVWMSPALRGDLSEEEYLEDPSSGTVRRARWSPNELRLEVALDEAAIVRVNQNWHPGWRASVGEVMARQGLLAVALPPGTHQVTLRFSPRSAVIGAIVSALALMALGGWVWAARRWPGRRRAVALGLGLGSLPLIAWAGLSHGYADPPAPPQWLNPDGSALLVDAVPTHVSVPDVSFEFPLQLLGAHIPDHADAQHEVPMELYWRVDGPVPRTVGIFVHIGHPQGKRYGADHEVVGGTFFFKNVPRGRVLRDAFRVNTSEWPAGQWTVRLGLWHASGDGSRVAAWTRDGQALADRSVVLGHFTVP
jgi:hypothetical protein